MKYALIRLNLDFLPKIEETYPPIEVTSAKEEE